MSKVETSIKHARRISVGIVGGLLLIIGIIAIPYPGPGWAIVFAALAILATEFDWAKRLLKSAKGKYDQWQAWLKRQSLAVQAIFFVLTCLVVIVTIWLLNGYGYLNDMFELGLDWVDSPLPWF